VGFIVGLIIGLAIAVVVAMMITKTPVPFINRPAKDKTSVTTPSQMTDPNKALYGNKDAAKEAAKEFAKDDAPATQQPAQPAAQNSAAQPADNKTPAKNDAKAPIVDKSTTDKAATDKSRDTVAKADNPDDKWIYFLQAGAFRDQAEAENAKAKLALQGFEAQISDRPSENGVLYRVRVGPFNGIDAMNKVRSKMSDNGVDVAVVRVPK
jgi:cell division protein FtsN